MISDIFLRKTVIYLPAASGCNTGCQEKKSDLRLTIEILDY
jgi:hypothetical protein